MRLRYLPVLLLAWILSLHYGLACAETVDLPADVLRDKIRGGLLGQILGNLNGLPHEMKYIHEPGNVTDYVPALPDGARTDDDTDFEWVYICVMQNENRLLLPPHRIARLWRTRINQRIWCSNQYARQLLDLGIEPPLTGMSVLNPWADFNISGQFICETFGLIAPEHACRRNDHQFRGPARGPGRARPTATSTAMVTRHRGIEPLREGDSGGLPPQPHAPRRDPATESTRSRPQKAAAAKTAVVGFLTPTRRAGMPTHGPVADDRPSIWRSCVRSSPQGLNCPTSLPSRPISSVVGHCRMP